MLAIGVEKDDPALFGGWLRLGRSARRLGYEAQCSMTMIVAISTEISGTVGVAVFVGAEAIREVGSVLEGPKLRF